MLQTPHQNEIQLVSGSPQLALTTSRRRFRGVSRQNLSQHTLQCCQYQNEGATGYKGRCATAVRQAVAHGGVAALAAFRVCSDSFAHSTRFLGDVIAAVRVQGAVTGCGFQGHAAVGVAESCTGSKSSGIVGSMAVTSGTMVAGLLACCAILTLGVLIDAVHAVVGAIIVGKTSLDVQRQTRVSDVVDLVVAATSEAHRSTGAGSTVSGHTAA